jgi:acetoin utilization protein AcuB
MTTKVVTILPGSTVADAVHLFVRHSFRHLLVAENGKLRGVLSDRDALRHMARGGNAQTGTVNGIMKTDPITAGPETSLRDAAELMRRHRINCLPVVDASASVLGIVTTTDLLGTLTQLLDAARRPS